MAAFKNKANGTWYVQFRYTDWKGERQQKLKRGFATKKEAQAWEREFLMQKQADVNMTFESFAQLYEKDMKPKLKSYSVLQDDFFEHMRSAGYDDVERGERGSSEEHLTVTQFKTEREQERLAQLQEVSALAQVEADKKNKEAASAEKKAAQARAKLDDVAPLLKGMEKLAADFSDDPERTLPEAGPLESAKSYREKKAKPLWEKIVKVLRSVYRAYFDLKSKFERLQSAYDREVSKNGSLSARIYEVCAERDGLKGQVRDYERVRRAIGPEQADRILEAAYQQEQVEKEQKWGARSKIRVGAR